MYVYIFYKCILYNLCTLYKEPIIVVKAWIENKESADYCKTKLYFSFELCRKKNSQNKQKNAKKISSVKCKWTQN